MDINGLRFTIEQTGGGCTAHVAMVEGGTIVTGDGNGGTDYATATQEGCSIAAGWYPRTTWQDVDDQHDSTVEGYGATVEAAVEALLVKVAQR